MPKKKTVAPEKGNCKQAAKIDHETPELDEEGFYALPAMSDPILTAFSRRIVRWWESLPEEERERLRRKEKERAPEARNATKR